MSENSVHENVWAQREQKKVDSLRITRIYVIEKVLVLLGQEYERFLYGLEF
jgi:hypothetical protein